MDHEIPMELRDPDTPAEVAVTMEARRPATDPRLGVHVEPVGMDSGPALNPLVTIGDSLTHGFQSGAIFNTDLSYPAIIAYELGILDAFRRPHYWGFGGLPMNIEYLVRELEREFGETVDWWEAPLAVFRARHWLAKMEDWWEHGPGSRVPRSEAINHNLGVFGWDLRDTLDRSWDVCHEQMQAPRSQLIPNVENGNNLAALRVLPSFDAAHRTLTPLTAAKELGDAGGGEPGIGTLIAFLGANNALSAVTGLKVKWTDDTTDYKDLERKGAFNVWRPSHFQSEFDLVMDQVATIRARHVIWTTAPHVTVIPLAHGVGLTKQRTGSRYFPNYTWPWVDDDHFSPSGDRNLTHQQVRAIDSAIDQYNEHIETRVREARGNGLDWYLLDVAGMLDRLASRRYIDDPEARPSWWDEVGGEYPLPPELAGLAPKVDSAFFRSDHRGRTSGGLFALDGVHPTTVAYGLVAQEFMRIMELAGVRFPQVDRDNPRDGGARVNVARLLARDSLMAHPPLSLASELGLVGWLDEVIDIFQHLFHRGPSAPKG